MAAKKKKRAKPKPKLDEFYWHEATDRMHIVLCLLDESLGGHPVIEQTPVLKAMYAEVERKMGDFYQKIAGVNPFNNEP